MNGVFSELSLEEYEFILCAFILIALICFYIFFRNWKRLRIIEDTPTAKLRSAHQGYIEVEGKGQLIDDQFIYAPLSNHRCIWYHSQIECRETFIHKGRSQTRWNTIYQNTSDHRFKLLDGMSNCFVDPVGAEVHSNEPLVWYGNTEWPTTTNILESQSILNNHQSRYRYKERLILPGQSLYIIGQFRTLSPTTHQSVRDVMRNLINDWKEDKQQLLMRFDTNKDGKISQDEWESARREAQLQAEVIYHELAQQPDTNLITKSDNTQRPFIISIHPQRLLIKKYRYTAYIALAMCLAVTSYIFWLIHTRG